MTFEVIGKTDYNFNKIASLSTSLSLNVDKAEKTEIIKCNYSDNVNNNTIIK